MDQDRRTLLKSAALAGLFSGANTLGACSRSTEQGARTASGTASGGASGKLSIDTIAAAEKVHGLSFTAKERSMLVDGLEADLEVIKGLHRLEFANDLAPALEFNPKLARKKISSQKNKLVLSNETAPPSPSTDEDLAFSSVSEQGAWLRRGDVTSLQLTENYLRRIRQHGDKVNCFATVTENFALAEAARADKEMAAGRDRGPLHGIPYGLKDLADTKDIPTTWGAAPYKDRTPEQDAEVVRKLKRAGAILLGKTTCGAIAYGDQWFGGRTRNPWNIEEGSSGSSAGSAAAIAAGLCTFSIGTETLGSIVSPSERCGTAGLRPTFGRVSRAGFMALCWSLDKVGPLCRNAEDTALVLSAINGYDADDPGTVRVGFTYDRTIDLSTLTVGYVPSWFERGDDVDRTALAALRDLGVNVKEFPWPEMDVSPLSQIVVVEAAAAFAELTLSERDDELSWQAPEAWPNTWRRARFFSAVDYVQIDRIRRRLMREMAEAFEGFDALIGPHYAGGALLATNCTGHPQLVLRAGFAQTESRTIESSENVERASRRAKTPRGISLWGDLFQEGKIIALGHHLENALGVAWERPVDFNK